MSHGSMDSVYLIYSINTLYYIREELKSMKKAKMKELK